MNENDNWGSWFRQSFDKILLFFTFLIAALLCLHMMKTSTDASNVAWWREIAGTVLGAFLGLVTGSRLAASHPNSFTGPYPPDSKIVRTLDATSKETTELTAPPSKD